MMGILDMESRATVIARRDYRQNVTQRAVIQRFTPLFPRGMRAPPCAPMRTRARTRPNLPPDFACVGRLGCSLYSYPHV